MVKLLVIADDFTGALDTGVQFQAKGTLIRLLSDEQSPFAELPEDTNVLIVDAETRHLPAAMAAKIVGRIVAEAAEKGVACIYKKTDSGLRGNIGAELAAARKASGYASLHFVPAYPQIGRTTRGGIHYIDGVPVAQSVFGKDPFEPVLHSDVAQIICSQSDVPVIPFQDFPYRSSGIVLHDAGTEQDLHRIAADLKERGQLHLLAGCAGFASVLPDLLDLEPADGAFPELTPRLLTICGSINPITLQQLDAAERSGVPRIRLNIQQKLDGGWLKSRESQGVIGAWAVLARTHESTIIECDGLGDPDALDAMRKKLGLDTDQMRCRISETMGIILKRLLDTGLDATLLVTGGDTLMAFMKQIGLAELIPICELASGVVLSQIHYCGKRYNLLSKSGGFGSKTLLADLEKILIRQNREVAVC